MVSELESCCFKVFFDFVDMHLQPGREDWVRHPDCIAELVSLVREVWVEECGGVASDWPWNNEYVLQTFIRIRKLTVERKQEARAKMTCGTLFPVPLEGIIYFIRNSRGHVKIGWTVREPENRLRELQTGESESLVLVAWMNGSARQERAMHVRFAAFRKSGEWFYPCEELDAIIRENSK